MCFFMSCQYVLMQSSFAVSVLPRSDLHYLLEYFGKICRGLIAHHRSDLTDPEGCIFQQIACFFHSQV